MDESNVLKNIIQRIKEQYVYPLVEKSNKSDFDSGALFGLGCALTVMQNDIESFLGENALKEYGLNLNCDDLDSWKK